MAHRNLASSNIKDHLGNKERIKPGSSIAFCKIHNFFLESYKATDATGKYYSYPVSIYILLVNSCILYSLVACHQGGLGKPVNFSCFFFFQEISRLKSFYFTGKFCFEFRSIKKSDHVSAGNTIDQSIPVIIKGISERCNRSHSCYNYSF